MTDAQGPTGRAVEAVWRIEAPRLLGGLVRLVRDLSLAEDLAQEALLRALETWPRTGIPHNPGAWLMTAARNRALDGHRSGKVRERKAPELALQESARARLQAPEPSAEEVGDDLMRLMLIACHPVLSKEARVALTLRLLGGLSTAEIARAFLAPEATIAQRIVRAKRTLGEARVPYEVPEGEALRARLPSVLEVIYLIFNEGYAAAAGEDWMRPALCREAMRLGRVLAAHVPGEGEAHGLVALMELQASRMRARSGPEGEPVLLLDQNRARWDHALVQHGLAALARAEALQQPLGPYTLQAAIAGCHARARTAEATDWVRIVALYDALVELTGSPVVELNRAMAVAMAFGPEQGLSLIDALVQEGALAGYHHLPAARGDLLERLGRRQEARAEFEHAAHMTRNAREREVLRERAQRASGEARK